MNDLDLIRKGDTRVLISIYRDYKGEFSRWIKKLFLLNTEEAEEIFQASVVTFYENVINNKLTDLKSSLKTYLFAIGKYKALEAVRRNNRTGSLSGDPDHEYTLPDDSQMPWLVEEQVQDEDQRLSVMTESLSELGHPCAEILTLFYFHHWSMALLKTHFNYKSEESIKSQKFKCVERLRKLYFQRYKKNI